MLEADCAIGHLLECAVDDSRAFCREKFGDSPEVELKQLGPGPAVLPLSLPAYIAFPVHELLKNAMGSHVRLVGADQLDMLPPIEVAFAVHAGWASIEITDTGGGWAPLAAPNPTPRSARCAPCSDVKPARMPRASADTHRSWRVPVLPSYPAKLACELLWATRLACLAGGPRPQRQRRA